MINELTGQHVITPRVLWVRAGRLSRDAACTYADLDSVVSMRHPLEPTDEAWGLVDGAWVPVREIVPPYVGTYGEALDAGVKLMTVGDALRRHGLGDAAERIASHVPADLLGDGVDE
jgi:hypothetical protein